MNKHLIKHLRVHPNRAVQDHTLDFKMTLLLGYGHGCAPLQVFHWVWFEIVSAKDCVANISGCLKCCPMQCCETTSVPCTHSGELWMSEDGDTRQSMTCLGSHVQGS